MTAKLLWQQAAVPVAHFSEAAAQEIQMQIYVKDMTDTGSQCCGSGFNGVPLEPIRIRDPDPEGQKWHTKIKKDHKCSLLGAEGFACSLDVLMEAKG